MSLIGIKPEQVPSNADLGSAAYRDADDLVAEAAAAVPPPDLSGLVTLATTQTVSGDKTFSSAPVLPGVNGGPLAGRRNFLHNGDMQVATTPTVRNILSTTPVINRFVADRWALSVGGAATMQLNTIATGGPISTLRRSLRVVTTVADSTVDAVDYVIVKQSLEAADIFPLIGRTFTLSFWARTSTVGTYSVAFRNGAGTSSYVAQFQMNAAAVWEYKTITVVGGLPASGHDWTGTPGMSVSFVLGAGSTYRTATTGTWLLSNVLAGTTAQSLQAGLARYMEISGMQLELGAVATPFEPTIFAVESAICRRYREAGYIYAGGYGIGGTNQRFGYVKFKEPKALGIPDLLLSNVSYGNASGIVTELVNAGGFGYYGSITGSGAYTVTGDWLVSADWG